MIAIDLGSNTLRVTKIDCVSGNFLSTFEQIVKTADMLEKTGVIHHESVDRIIYAIEEAKKRINFSNHEIRAVTTEAIRQASNAKSVIIRIEKETGILFDIITGEAEAELTLIGVKNRLRTLKHRAKSIVLVDIGGASTEIIFAYETETYAKSFPIGIVTTAQKYADLEVIKKALHKDMLEMQMFCAEIYATKGEVDTFVATAGTPTTVAAMKLGQNYATYDAKKINGTSVEKDELDYYLNKLIELPFEKREKLVGVGRSDLIAAGILIYKHMFSLVEFDTCIVIDDGLREGLALSNCIK